MNVAAMIAVLEEAKSALEAPGNDFAWSPWEDSGAALAEIGGLLEQLRKGEPVNELTLNVLFAPTGPIQEVSVSSGWGQEFIEMSVRFDAALTS